MKNHNFSLFSLLFNNSRVDEDIEAPKVLSIGTTKGVASVYRPKGSKAISIIFNLPDLIKYGNYIEQKMEIVSQNDSFAETFEFDDAIGPRNYGDPLVLNLSRDGMTNSDDATYFDLNANGFQEYSQWIDETEAFQILDVVTKGILRIGSKLIRDIKPKPNDSMPSGVPLLWRGEKSAC